MNLTARGLASAPVATEVSGLAARRIPHAVAAVMVIFVMWNMLVIALKPLAV
ncbi:MAG TPA: hypothetical protein VHV75_11695 [Solirubrobacteraceae bacterium]|jgi:vacuolar-type H+-ATPase subunit I/STV1|nr:hypothetical protein [Solirubrobacteraceae bacterium]